LGKRPQAFDEACTTRGTIPPLLGFVLVRGEPEPALNRERYGLRLAKAIEPTRVWEFQPRENQSGESRVRVQKLACRTRESLYFESEQGLPWLPAASPLADQAHAPVAQLDRATVFGTVG
jgi:hypothetical protein